jgi:hypothetical protein
MLGLLSQARSDAGRYTRGERISLDFELNDPPQSLAVTSFDGTDEGPWANDLRR